MHLRRGVLLFAVVLGLSALVAAVSAPVERTRTAPLPPPPPGPPAPRPQAVRFAAKEGRRVRRIDAGRHALVTVEVRRPGQVELERLGVTAAAEPLTAARFDLVVRAPGRYDVLYTPAGEVASRRVGVLVVSGSRTSGRSGPASR